MRSSRTRQILLFIPLLCAGLGLVVALGLTFGPSAASTGQSALRISLLLALLAVAAAIAQALLRERARLAEAGSGETPLAESQQAMDSVSDGVIVYSHDWRFLYLNRSALEVAAKPREELIGQVLWEVYPALVGGDLQRRYLLAQRERNPICFEYFSEPTQQWLELRLFPTAGRITLVLRDVTMQHAARAQLEHARESIAQELRKSEEIAGSLRGSNKQLAERNRQLHEFAHIASHDLQEPVRKIRIFGEMLRENAQGLDATGKDYLNRMLGASTRMQSLIASLLSFARIGVNPSALVPLDVRGLVTDVLAELQAGTDGPAAQVTVGELPTVVGDPVLLRQVMQNLLANAFKFVKAGECPKIEITGEIFRPEGVASDWCRLTVRDDGIGFEPSEAEHVFDLFRRLHGRGKYEGSGIGLAIVRRIVEHHGGRVRASSAPGQGAAFDVELPLSPPAPALSADAGNPP